MPTETIGLNTTDTYTGFVDTFISEGSATTNYGTANYMEVNKYTGGGWNMGIVKATGIASLPANIIISAVSLHVRVNAADKADGTYVISAKRMLRDWVTAQATWNVYATASNWTTAGAQGDATDRAAAATFASAGLDLTTGYKTLTGDLTAISDVQAMYAGTLPNYGWLLERTDNFNDFGFRNLDSSDAADGIRPYLTVTYTVPAGQPRDKRSNTVPGSRLGGSKFGRGV
jgi:hypothetical protein